MDPIVRSPNTLDPSVAPTKCASPNDADAGVEALQARGSEAFRAGRHEEAARLYSDALALRADDAALLSNRSAAWLALGRAESALDDAVAAVRLRPKWGKVHGRHGAALAALQCTRDAVSAYERGVALAPDSSVMRTELSRLRQLLAASTPSAALPSDTENAPPLPDDLHEEDPNSVGDRVGDRVLPPSAAIMEGQRGATPSTSASTEAGAGTTPPAMGSKPAEVTLGRNKDGTGGVSYVRVADTDELRAQGTEAFKTGDFEGAEAKWTAALRRRPDDATLLSNRSAARLALGEKQLALEDATRCVEIDPNWHKGHSRVGAALAALGRTEEAVAAYERGLKLEPDSELLHAEVTRLKAEAEQASSPPPSGLGGAQVSLSGLDLAKACNKMGRPQQAIRELDKLIGSKVADAELYCERSVAHAACHRLALAHEDAATAVYLYGQQHDPDVKPWENPKELGIKLMTRQEKNELARKEGRSFLLRGEAEIRLCDYDTAMRTYQLGCKADARLGPDALKELREAWYAAKELCRGWRRAGRLRKAEKKKLAFAAQRRPVLHDIASFERPEDKALALRNLASIHTRWGMHEDAIMLLTDAIAHTPTDQYLVHQRAKEHVTMGNYELALPDAEQVVRERPGWIEGIISLGDIESKVGKWKSAAVHWHEAIQLQPHNPNLRRDLERAVVEMTEEEAEQYREVIALRQTGDEGDVDHEHGAVEMEVYVDGGREFFRPKGTGERLEREKLQRYAEAAERKQRLEAKATVDAATGADVGEVTAAHPEFLQSFLEQREGDAVVGRKARVVGEELAARRRPGATPGGADEDWGRYEKGGGDSGVGGRVAPLVGRSVIIDGLIARPELNGSRGVATSFNSETGRYNVQLPKGDTIALRASNLAAAVATGGASATTGTNTGTGAGAGAGTGVAHPSRAGAAAQAAAPLDEAQARKASIGARLAAKRNAKGIAWATKGVDGGMGGMFASEEKRREVAERRAANPISEDYDEVAEAEAARKAAMSPEEREIERKVNALKDLATKHLRGMDIGRTISFLDDALKMRPKMKELWSNRSHAWELMHEHEKALKDGEETIRVAPDWPKGYLRTARALMSLERGAEAAARLRTALEMAPRDEVLLGAYKEAMGLAECTRRTERAIRASQMPTFNGVGDSDIVDIARGACRVKGCDCNAYIQKHGRTTVHLIGRGHVRQDNDESFFLCARCGHDCVKHKDLRDLSKQKPKPGKAMGASSAGLPKAPASYSSANKATDRIDSVGVGSTYTNAGMGTRGGLNSSYYYATALSASEAQATPAGAPIATHDAGGGVGGGHADKDEWADELDPSLVCQSASVEYDDPFATAAAAVDSDLSDPLATTAAAEAESLTAAAGGGDGGMLEDVDPLGRTTTSLS